MPPGGIQGAGLKKKLQRQICRQHELPFIRKAPQHSNFRAGARDDNRISSLQIEDRSPFKSQRSLGIGHSSLLDQAEPPPLRGHAGRRGPPSSGIGRRCALRSTAGRDDSPARRNGLTSLSVRTPASAAAPTPSDSRPLDGIFGNSPDAFICYETRWVKSSLGSVKAPCWPSLRSERW